MTDSSSITVSRESETTTVTGAGSLDLRTAGDLQHALKGVTDSEDLLVVDFQAVSYVDTAIVAALVVAAKTLSRKNRRVKLLVTDGSHPQYVLNIMGLDTLIDMVVAEKSNA
jgi:anti-anti-sigma factor